MNADAMTESFNGWERWCRRLTADTALSVDEARDFCVFARQWLPSLLMRAALRPGLVPVSPVRDVPPGQAGTTGLDRATPGLHDIAELLRDRARTVATDRPDMARLMWQGAQTLDALLDAIAQRARQGDEQPLLGSLARSLPVMAETLATDQRPAARAPQPGADEEKSYLRQKVDSLVGALTEQAGLHGVLTERVKTAEARAKAAEAEAKRLHKTLASLQINPTVEPSGEIVAAMRDALGLLRDERKRRDKGEERERALREELQEARIEQASRPAAPLQLEALTQLPRNEALPLPFPQPATPQLAPPLPDAPQQRQAPQHQVPQRQAPQPALRSSAPMSYREPEAGPRPVTSPTYPAPAYSPAGDASEVNRGYAPPAARLTPPPADAPPPKPPAQRLIRPAPDAGLGQRPIRSSDQAVAAYRAHRAGGRPQAVPATIAGGNGGPGVQPPPQPARPPQPAPTPSRAPARDNGARIQFITSDDV